MRKARDTETPTFPPYSVLSFVWNLNVSRYCTTSLARAACQCCYLAPDEMAMRSGEMLRLFWWFSSWPWRLGTSRGLVTGDVGQWGELAGTGGDLIACADHAAGCSPQFAAWSSLAARTSFWDSCIKTCHVLNFRQWQSGQKNVGREHRKASWTDEQWETKNRTSVLYHSIELIAVGSRRCLLLVLRNQA